MVFPGPRVLGPGIRGTLLILGLPVISDLLVAVLDRGVRDPVGALALAVLLGGAVVRLGERALGLLRRPFQRPGSSLSLAFPCSSSWASSVPPFVAVPPSSGFPGRRRNDTPLGSSPEFELECAGKQPQMSNSPEDTPERDPHHALNNPVGEPGPLQSGPTPTRRGRILAIHRLQKARRSANRPTRPRAPPARASRTQPKIPRQIGGRSQAENPDK